MEDDEDCYGFGALSDMFDSHAAAPFSSGGRAAPATEPKRLDVAALSRFWWSERRLNEFRRGAQRHAKEFHHIAAKMDGVRVDGGLGSAFLVPRGSARGEDGGVLWVQAQASDSNAQARRKKEFQDITNRQDALKTPKGGSKSTATVFLRMDDILEATETSVQNTVQGIKFTLRSGPQFEIAFMPGPFYDARNRNEMLHAFNKQQVDDVFSPDPSPVRATSANTPSVFATSSSSLLGRGSRDSSPDSLLSQTSSRSQTPFSSPGDAVSTLTRAVATTETPADPECIREANRSLIRRYAQLNENNSEAIAIAQKIHATTNYQLGPLAEEFPSFSTDSAYRKRTVDGLTRTIERMNHDWKLSEQERLLHTRAGCGRGDDDVFQYTDTITHERISPSSYRQRYMNFVEAEHPETHPVIRMFEPRLGPARATNDSSATKCTNSFVSSEEESPSYALPSASAVKIFGIDFSRSSIVDVSLLSGWKAMPCPTDEDVADWDDLVGGTFVVDARDSVIASVSEAIQNLPQRSVRSTMTLPGGDDETSPGDVHSRRRSASRRKSLDQPSLEDLRSQFARCESSSSSEHHSANHPKRRRSGEDGSPTTTRRRRRQSLVGTLDPSLAEEKTEGINTSSSLVRAQPKDTTCPLCCDANAVVVMKPCDHAVCRTCWNRLAHAENVSPGEGLDVRQCPWDREAVVER